MWDCADDEETCYSGFAEFGGGAEVAQLVERNLAKVEVAGSNPVFRSAATWPSG